MPDYTVLDVDAAANAAAIYTVPDTNPGDDAPLRNPRANYSRLKFHSNFDYVRIVEDRTVSLALASLAGNARRFTTYNLFAHGRNGVPVVLGAMFIPGSGWCPLHIGAPTLQINTNNTTQPVNNRQLLSLGANATHVIMRESTWSYAGSNGGAPMQPQTLSVRVLVTSELL